MTQIDQVSSWAIVDSALGAFAVGGTEQAIVSVLFPDEIPSVLHDRGDSALVARGAAELDEYLSGSRTTFDLPLASQGTAFQESVWSSLGSIPYGAVQSYGWVADRIGRPQSPRAVGQALGRNPIPIFRPCHRVVASNGIGGFGGGDELKQALLSIEGFDLSTL
jgi:O-6-methylguanine DNA methyltransferase